MTFNAFSRETLPSHMTEERDRHYRILYLSLSLALLLAILFPLYAPLNEALFHRIVTHRFSLSSAWALLVRYNTDVVTLNFHDMFIASGYFAGFANGNFDVTPITKLMGWLLFGSFLGFTPQFFNKHKKIILKAGYADWCDDDALKQMEARKQVGIAGGRLMTLGRWQGRERKGQMVQMIETLSSLCLAPPGTGKCLHPDEPVLMFDGTTKRTGALVVGDLLMGPDSKPRRILSTSTGYGPLYRVTPNKGRSWICNGYHILSLRNSKEPRRRARNPLRGHIKFTSVEDYLAWSPTQKSLYKQWRAAVDFQSNACLKIDPYRLGLLLGDGTTNKKAGLHTADNELVAEIYAEAEARGLQIREEHQEGNRSGSYFVTAGNATPGERWRANSLLAELRDYGLDVPCCQKFIPHDYKTASADDRLALLAGLIDTDGSYDPAGRGYDFCTASETLANDIAFVARSLGLAAYPTPRIIKNTVYWRLFISGDVDRIPVKLFRRHAESRRINKDVTNVGFEIEPIGDGPYFGIIIDGDHQYLLDDFTVTHNTAAFVIPTIITADRVSLIVNDPKPEIRAATGAHRETVSSVYMLDWSKVDTIDEQNPERSVFYPRFNFLSPLLVPPRGPNRDTYIDSIAKVMIPDPKGGGDTYFVNKGRAAFTGFCHYLITVFSDNADNTKFQEELPEDWRGKEPSLPMLSDWIAYAQLENTKPVEQEQESYGGPPPSTDRLGDWIRKLCEIIKPGEDNKRLASPRAFLELSSLVNMADKERSGVLGTMDQALLPFKNEAVKQRTSATDFTPDDMRGVLKQEILARTRLPPNDQNYLNPGRTRYVDDKGLEHFKWASEEFERLFYEPNSWLPLTLYVCVNQAEAAAFATITALLYEVLSNSLISFGPYEHNEKTDRILGPFPVLFVLDEFAKLPKSESVLRGPDLGRSKQTSYAFYAQDYGQLELIYSKADVSVINSTTAVKIILQQNNADTTKQIIEMVGETTIMRHSKSTQEGFSKAANPLAWSSSENLEAVKMLRHEDIAALPPGQVIVLVQGFLNRPMKLLAPFFFNDPLIAPLVRSRGKGPVARQTIPDHQRMGRVDEIKFNISQTEARRAQATAADAVHDPTPQQAYEIVTEEPAVEFEDA